MRLSVSFLDEPVLVFGSNGESIDPKLGLARFGPKTALTDDIVVGIIGPEKEVGELTLWLERCQSPIWGKIGNLHLDPHFPGFQRAFGTRIGVSRSWDFLIPKLDLQLALSDPDPASRFRRVVSLYSERVEAAADIQPPPDVIMLALSQHLINVCGAVHLRRQSSRRTKKVPDSPGKQLVLFDEELEVVEEDSAESREIYRNFRRTIKNRVMQWGVPVQLATPRLWLDRPDSQHPATKAWNFCTGLFFKAGGIPWQWKDIPQRTCYVGISFFHPVESRELTQTSLAQVFTSRGEGIVIRGQRFELQHRHASPHMPGDLAADLLSKALKSYTFNSNNLPPERLVVHKSSKYWPDETEGLVRAASNVPFQTYVALDERDIRFVRYMQRYPPLRGTLCKLDSADEAFLFTRGSMAIRKSYPGPYVPKPLVIAEHFGDSAVERIGAEILGLSKLNWNAALMANFHPITLQFARRVGDILSAADEQTDIASQFRFYM